MEIIRNENLIKKKIFQLFLPCFLYSAALQLGNICDNLFIGSFLGTKAIAIVALGMNIDALIEIPSLILGTGGNALASTLLGQQNKKMASRVFSQTMLLSLIFGIVFLILAPFSHLISSCMAVERDMVEGLSAFIFFTLLGAPVRSIALQLITYVTMDNNAKLSSIYLVVATFVKLCIEYLFLKNEMCGVGIAALSTTIGYSVAMLVFIAYFQSKKRMLTLINPFIELKKNFMKMWIYLKPEIAENVGGAVFAFAFEMYLLIIGGSDTLVVYAVSNTIFCLMFFVAGGFIRLIPATIGILYGAKDYFGVKNVIKRIYKLSLCAIGVLAVLLCVFPAKFLQLFGFEIIQLEPIHYMTIYLTSINLFLRLTYFIAKRYYQMIGEDKLSSLLVTAYECGLRIPLEVALSLLALAIGINFYYGVLIGAILTGVCTLTMGLMYIRKKTGSFHFWLLPEQEKDISLNITVNTKNMELESVCKKIMDFMISNSVKRKYANLIALATEEMLVTINEVNIKNSSDVDIDVRFIENEIVLNIRSDGEILDPSSYNVKNEDFSSLAIMNKITDSIQYLRIMDLNSTNFVFKNKMVS